MSRKVVNLFIVFVCMFGFSLFFSHSVMASGLKSSVSQKNLIKVEKFGPGGIEARGWYLDGKWRYILDNGFCLADTWAWIDGNSDGLSECYYFNSEGYMLDSIIAPGGFVVNRDGAWEADGVVQRSSSNILPDSPETIPIHYGDLEDLAYYGLTQGISGRPEDGLFKFELFVRGEYAAYLLYGRKYIGNKYKEFLIEHVSDDNYVRYRVIDEDGDMIIDTETRDFNKIKESIADLTFWHP